MKDRGKVRMQETQSLSLQEWMASKVEMLLDRNRQELDELQQKIANLNQDTWNWAHSEIEEEERDTQHPREEFIALVKKRARRIFNEEDGSELWKKMKTLEPLVNFLEGALEALEDYLPQPEETTPET
jgi:hypothetical protein